jgi:hypothetical protein
MDADEELFLDVIGRGWSVLHDTSFTSETEAMLQCSTAWNAYVQHWQVMILGLNR